MPAANNPPTPTAAIPATSTAPRSTLPPPATFDFLPPLHALLARLLLPPSTITVPSNSPQTSQSDQPLSPKDLATAASTITAKIQKARVAVRSVEGVETNLEEQEEIIAELEAEILRGKERLKGLRSACARVATEDTGSDDSNSGNERAKDDHVAIKG